MLEDEVALIAGNFTAVSAAHFLLHKTIRPL
jgi:hypothetical protein